MDKKPATKKAEAKKPAQEKAPVKDLLDVLLDQENRDPIVLMDENGRQLTFEQVAIIPYDIEGEDRRLYVILKPVDKIDGIADDEAVVFVCDQDKEGRTVLKVEENEEIAISVFDKFYDLLEEATKEKKTAAKTSKAVAEKKAANKTAAKSAAGKTAGKTAGKAAPKKKA